MDTGTHLDAEVAKGSALIRSSMALAGLHWGRTWAVTCLVDTQGVEGRGILLEMGMEAVVHASLVVRPAEGNSC